MCPPGAGDAQFERWLPADLHRDAARAAVQTLGRFMACYFTNQPLCILPPHSVEPLPPLHLPHGETPALQPQLTTLVTLRTVIQRHAGLRDQV